MFLRGYLVMAVKGTYVFRFLNLCSYRGISMWEIQHLDEQVHFKIYLSDFKTVCQLAKKTKCRLHIVEKKGIKFLTKIVKYKALFIAGFLLFCLGLFCSDAYVWNLELEGNLQISDEQMTDVLYAIGIREGIRKKEVDLEATEEHFRNTFPQITWICARYVGNTLQIVIKENQLPDYGTGREEDYDGMASEGIVARQKGKIVGQIVRKGVALFPIGTEVEQGQLLISDTVPILMEDGSVVLRDIGKADGDVWLEYQIPIEETYRICEVQKRYTGRKRRTLFLLWNAGEEGNGSFRRIRKNGFSYEDAVTLPLYSLHLKMPDLHVMLMQRETREYQYVRENRSVEQSKAYFQKKLREFIETLEGKGVHIIEKDVKMENDGVYYSLTGFVKVIGPCQENVTGDY